MNRLPVARFGLLVSFMLFFASCGGILPGSTTRTILPIPEEVPRDQAQWTILVYMPAEGTNEGEALVAINQLEAGIGEEDEVNVVVLVDRGAGSNTSDGNWTGTRLYEIVSDSQMNAIHSVRLGDPVLGVSAVQDLEKDLSDPALFTNFLEFGKQYFPSQNTAVILWGYSEGITGENYAQNWTPPSGNKSFGSKAVGYDESSSRQLLTVKAISTAVASFDEIELVGFDAPMTGLVEFAYQFSGVVPWFAASQDSIGASKWNYQDLLVRFTATDKSVDDLLAAVCQSYEEAATGEYASLTLVDTSKLNDLVEAFEAFTEAVSTELDDDDKVTETRVDLFNLQQWGYAGPGDMQLDIANLADYFIEKEIAADEAEGLAQKLEAAVHWAWNFDDDYAMNGLSVYFARLNASTNPLSGLPEMYDANNPGLHFVGESGWAELLARIWGGE